MRLPSPMRRLRGAQGMGLTWAVAWAAGGILIGVTSRLLPGRLWDAFFRAFDAPLPALAVPGFVGGVVFSVVLHVAARRRRLESLSLGQFALWGAIGGTLLSLVPVVLVGDGSASQGAGGAGVWSLWGVLVGPFGALGAATATGALAIVRRGARASLPSNPDMPELPDVSEPTRLRAP